MEWGEGGGEKMKGQLPILAEEYFLVLFRLFFYWFSMSWCKASVSEFKERHNRNIVCWSSFL